MGYNLNDPWEHKKYRMKSARMQKEPARHRIKTYAPVWTRKKLIQAESEHNPLSSSMLHLPFDRQPLCSNWAREPTWALTWRRYEELEVWFLAKPSTKKLVVIVRQLANHIQLGFFYVTRLWTRGRSPAVSKSNVAILGARLWSIKEVLSIGKCHPEITSSLGRHIAMLVENPPSSFHEKYWVCETVSQLGSRDTRTVKPLL
jgi:hypothetical protein